MVTDTLSRMVDEVELTGNEVLDLETIVFESDEYLAIIKEGLEKKDRLPDLKVEDGVMFRRMTFSNGVNEMKESRLKMWILAGLTSTLIEKAHDVEISSHGGQDRASTKTVLLLARLGNSSREIREGVPGMQEFKPSNQISNPGIGKPVVVERSFLGIHIDFLGKYPRSKRGNCFIFIFVDAIYTIYYIDYTIFARTRSLQT